MSKITMAPNSLGTGTFTIASPNSNSDRTLTLPDVTGTLLSTDASGNLGLGVTPNTWSYRSLSIGNAGSAVWQTGGDFGLSNNAYNNGGWKYNSTGGAAVYDISSGGHYWFTAPSGTAGNPITFTQAMTLNANGALALQGGNTSATGVGITFPATQSASSDANTLDDYEEGTWTPTYVNGVTSPVYTGTGGYYVKVGRMVYVSLRIQLSSGTANGNQVQIGGLPFTITFGTGTQAAMCIGYQAGFRSDGNITMLGSADTTKIDVWLWSGAAFGGTNANNIQAAMHISGCYEAA